MRKILLTAAIAAFTWLSQAQAMPQPNDVVWVMNWGSNEQAPVKRYTKKWKEIKLSASTLAKLTSKIKQLEADGYQKFKVAYIRIGGDRLDSVLLLGDWGTAIAIHFYANDTICKVSIDGNGGPIGDCDGM